MVMVENLTKIALIPRWLMASLRLALPSLRCAVDRVIVRATVQTMVCAIVWIMVWHASEAQTAPGAPLVKLEATLNFAGTVHATAFSAIRSHPNRDGCGRS